MTAVYSKIFTITLLFRTLDDGVDLDEHIKELAPVSFEIKKVYTNEISR